MAHPRYFWVIEQEERVIKEFAYDFDGAKKILIEQNIPVPFKMSEICKEFFGQEDNKGGQSRIDFKLSEGKSITLLRIWFDELGKPLIEDE